MGDSRLAGTGHDLGTVFIELFEKEVRVRVYQPHHTSLCISFSIRAVSSALRCADTDTASSEARAWSA